MTTRREVVLGGLSSALLAAGFRGVHAAESSLSAIPVTGEWRASGLSPEINAVFDAQREAALAAMKEHAIPGFAIACLNRNGVMWEAGFGYEGMLRKLPVTPQTRFSVQSVSKMFSATAIQMATAQGLLNLDTPVHEYIPGFRINSVFESSPAKRITLRMLLSHRAGFTHEAPVGSNFSTAPSFNAHIQSIQETWLRARVGSQYLYSNLGVDLAGYIYQRCAGKPFETLMRERLFLPLGMTGSFVDTLSHNGSQSGCAQGHSKSFDSYPSYIPLPASGGARASVRDCAKFIGFHLNSARIENKPLMSAEKLEEMQKPLGHTGEGGYGLGIGSFKFDDSYVLAHTGGGFGFQSILIWLPQYSIGVVALTNSSDHPGSHSKIAAAVLNGLAKHLPLIEGVPTATQFFANAPSPDKPVSELKASEYQPVWDKYCGDYAPVYAKEFVVAPGVYGDGIRSPQIKFYKKDNALWVQGLGADEPLMAHSDKRFFGINSGEAADFGGSVPTWRNIRLSRAA